MIRRLLPLLLILIPMLTPAQEKIPRQLYVFPTEAVSEGGFARETLVTSQGKAFDQYLRLNIAENTDVIIVDTEDEADCLLRTVLTDTGEDMSITVFAVDTFFDRDAFKITYPVEEFSIITLQDSLFKDLSQQIETHFPPRDPEVVEVVTEKVVEDIQTKQVFVEGEGNFITIRGLPGTVLTSQTGEVYEIGEEGEVTLGFPIGVSVLLDAELPGYFPERLRFVIEGEDIEYDLQMQKVSRWVLDARFRLTDFSLCPGVQWFYIPHHGYVSFFLDENLLSIASLARAIDGYKLLTFIMPTLGSGWLFFHPDSGVRIGVSLSLYMRLVVPFDAAPYISKEMPFGFQPAFIFEFSPWRRIRFYFEWAGKFFFSPGNANNDYQVSYNDDYRWIAYWRELRLARGFYVYPFAWYLGGRILF